MSQNPANSGPAFDAQAFEAAIPAAVEKAVPAAFKDSPMGLDDASPEAIPAAVEQAVPAAMDEPFASLEPEVRNLAEPVAQMQPLLEGLPAGNAAPAS